MAQVRRFAALKQDMSNADATIEVKAAEESTDDSDGSLQDDSGEQLSHGQLSLEFSDLNGDPIQGLDIRVLINGTLTECTTDAEGRAPKPLTSYPNATFELRVKRFGGGYKLIDSCRMPAQSNACWSYVSPNLVLEVSPDLHEGDPGTIEQAIPHATEDDAGDLAAVLSQDEDIMPSPLLPAEQEEEVAPPAPAPVPAPASKAVPPKPAPAPKAPAAAARTASTPQHVSNKAGQASAKTDQVAGRDAQGRPMTVVAMQKVKDWWNSWQMPTLNLWGAPPQVSRDAVVKAQARSPAPAGTQTSASKVRYTPDMPAKVAALVEFATLQTQYNYTGEGTTGVLGSMTKGTFQHKIGEKDSSTSLGKCYQYVKIALTRTNVIDGILGDKMAADVQESASKAAPALEAKGFIDVTNELPDARWAATGDIVVYAWSEKTWAARKKTKPSTPNHGHIDIRGEQTYISDFVPGLGNPSWFVSDPTEPTKFYPNYVNVRVYRKFYDPTPTCRIRAFLACLREFECQAIKNDADRYMALNTALPSAPKSKTFTGFDTHPWDKVPKDQWPASTAAGAYQITRTAWREALDQRCFPDAEGKATFTPQMQDRIAVRRLEFRKALHLVRACRLEEAVAATRTEWTSLPGAKENQNRRTADGKPMDMAYLKGLFDKFLTVELAKFGIGVK